MAKHRSDNPLKNENQPKNTTRRLGETAPNAGEHTADVNLSSQQGGVTPTDAGASAADRFRTAGDTGAGPTTRRTGSDRWAASPQSSPASGVKRRGPSPADERSSNRTGTAPDRSGVATRSGNSKGERRRKGRDV